MFEFKFDTESRQFSKVLKKVSSDIESIRAQENQLNKDKKKLAKLEKKRDKLEKFASSHANQARKKGGHKATAKSNAKLAAIIGSAGLAGTAVGHLIGNTINEGSLKKGAKVGFNPKSDNAFHKVQKKTLTGIGVTLAGAAAISHARTQKAKNVDKKIAKKTVEIEKLKSQIKDRETKLSKAVDGVK